MSFAVIFGANGLVGHEIHSLLQKAGKEAIGLCFKRQGPGFRSVDIQDFMDVERVLRETSPKVVFHCANRAGGVNACERDKDAATEFHFKATANMARMARDLGAKFVFISTDYVFSDSTVPVGEDHPTGPLNHYGKVKLMAEDWLRENSTDWLVIRTTNIYGYDPRTRTPNYFMQALRKLEAGETFRAASNLWGTPTYVLDLAQGIVALVERGERGVYNIVGPDYVHRAQWARRIAEKLGYDPALIEEFEDHSSEVKRPQRLRLAMDKFAAKAKLKMRGVDEALEDILQRRERDE